MTAPRGLKIYAIGHDFGNVETCCVISGNGYVNQTRQIPSIFAVGNWREVETMAHASGQSISSYLQYGHYVLSYTNEQGQLIEKIIGRKVFDDGRRPAHTRGDKERYWLNHYNLEMLMVGSAATVTDQIYGLHVVTGLPVHLYTIENMQAVIAALHGTHTFKLNNVDRSMAVLSVKVIAEGAGALLAYGSNSNRVEGVIDIGGETTDLFAARNQKPISDMCHSLEKGVAAAAELFNAKFREHYGRLLPMGTVQELMRQHVSKQAFLEVRDSKRRVVQPMDLAALIDYALDAVGQEIATFVQQSWSNHLYDMGRALLVGGGAHYFKRSILERLPFAKAVPVPEMANAEGYVRLATAIADQQQAVS